MRLQNNLFCLIRGVPDQNLFADLIAINILVCQIKLTFRSSCLLTRFGVADQIAWQILSLNRLLLYLVACLTTIIREPAGSDLVARKVSLQSWLL